jgi:sulfide dehydrogenase [flavocytochrome c] flavoprotein subunit
MNSKTPLSRRDIIKLSALGVTLPAAVGLSGCDTLGLKSKGHVVVIGGGFGGAAAAKYLKRFDQQVAVTLIEPNSSYVTCPGSNWVIGGLAEMKEITHTYQGLAKQGVKVIHAKVEQADTQKRQLTLSDGTRLDYDKLIVSPGIDFKWDVHEGVNPQMAQTLPHAWKAGDQTLLLRDQIRSMKRGGTFVMVAPPNPFRCPPGPYERAAMVAYYLKQNNPTAKILILDQKDSFSKQGLFMEGWQNEYGSMIQWVSSADGGKLDSIDVQSKTLTTGWESVTADVINYIPPQKAGAIAALLGLTNASGFCPIDAVSFESAQVKDLYVIGDAAIAGTMPKSGHSAVQQAKQCAANVILSLRGEAPMSSKSANTCYSLISKDYAISVAAVFEAKDGKIADVAGAGGVSKMNAPAIERQLEAQYTLGWYKSITDEVWG